MIEIQYFGGNCIKVSNKKSTVFVDDNLADLGGKTHVGEKDIALYTATAMKPAEKSHFSISGPGEYEVSDISIQGVKARAHMDESSAHTATIYRVIMEDIRIAFVGHIYPELSEELLEAIGTIDILCIPVGGSGYTLDGVGAHKVINQIEPKIVIPTHYDDKSLNYEVPQNDLATALKDIALEPAETVDSLKLKGLEFSEGVKLIVLQKQN